MAGAARLLIGAAALLAIAAAVFAWQSRAVDVPLVSEFDAPSLDDVTEALLPRTHARHPDHFRLGYYDPGSRSIPIELEGGYCVGDRQRTMTRVAHVDVEEGPEAIHLAAYTRDPGESGRLCAGVGAPLHHRVHLQSPVGDRTVFDDSYAEPRRRPETTIPPGTGLAIAGRAAIERCSARRGDRMSHVRVTGLDCDSALAIAGAVAGPGRIPRRYTCAPTRHRHVLCLAPDRSGVEFAVSG
jgi:hypothetical protein